MKRISLRSGRLSSAVNRGIASLGLVSVPIGGVILALSVSNASANEVVWNGGAGGSWDWGQAANWAGDASPEINNSSIIHFAGAASSTGGNCWDNLGWWNSYNQIIFDAGATGFNVQGDSIILAPNGSTPGMIVNNSSNDQAFNSGAFTLQGGTQINAVSADISIGTGNPIYIDSSGLGSAIVFNGGNGHNVTISDQLFNGSASGQLILQANDVVKLSASNGYSGGTTVNAGVIEVQNNNALGSGAVVVNTGGVVSLQDTTTITNAITLNGGAISWHFQPALPGAYSGLITLDAAGGTVPLLNYYGAGAVNGTISGSISGVGGLTVTDSNSAGFFTGGTLVLSGSNSYSGGTTVIGTTLALNSAAAFPIGTSLNVSGGASVVVANHGTNSTYAPVVSLLTNSGTIDITNNALVVQNNSIGAITTQVAHAFGAGVWTGSTAGAITSSSAASDTSRLTAVGVIQNDDGASHALYSAFEGQTVSDSDVLVKYTYYGDADLNGAVDGSDYSRIDNAYLNNQTSAPLTGWYNGDFNYDGAIDGSDYTLIDNAFNSQGSQIAAEIASPTAQIAAVSGVPEPTALSLLAMGCAGLLRRRRYCRH